MAQVVLIIVTLYTQAQVPQYFAQLQKEPRRPSIFLSKAPVTKPFREETAEPPPPLSLPPLLLIPSCSSSSTSPGVFIVGTSTAPAFLPSCPLAFLLSARLPAYLLGFLASWLLPHSLSLPWPFGGGEHLPVHSAATIVLAIQGTSFFFFIFHLWASRLEVGAPVQRGCERFWVTWTRCPPLPPVNIIKG